MNLKNSSIHQRTNRSAIKKRSVTFCTPNVSGFLGILLLTGVLFTNIYQLQIVNFDTYQTRSNGNRIKLLPLPPTRGLIYDRYGKLLAENLTFLVYTLCQKKLKI